MSGYRLRLFVSHSFTRAECALDTRTFRQAVSSGVAAAMERHNATDSEYAFAVVPHFEERASGRILPAQVRTALERADIVLVDISGLSPNVLYELGYAHASGRHLILVDSEDAVTDVPLDLKDLVIGFYRDAETLQAHIDQRLTESCSRAQRGIFREP